MPIEVLKDLRALPLMDRVRAYIVGSFSALVGLAFVVSLGSMVYFKVKMPEADIGLWLNVFLTCLGYIVGILTGLLGIPAPNPPPPPPSQPGHEP